ncbi:MAG: M12 family metallo-peptidase [Flavobacteriaceae bacterium]
MIKKVLFSVFLLSSILMFGQENWNKTTTDSKDDVIFLESHMPTQFQLYTIDLDAIKEQLDNINSNSINESTTILSFPNAKGELQRFRMVESSVMEDELALKFPMIKTYAGLGIEDPTASLRMSIATDGLHVMVLSGTASALYIDPFTRKYDKYIVYAKNALPAISELVCGVEDNLDLDLSDMENAQRNATDGNLRTYRLAVACTTEYSTYHLNQQGVSPGATLAVKKAAVLSAITTTVNRVTGIYEKETAITFELVATNNNIIFINSDNFTNNNTNALIVENQTQITNIIGVGNFDVGHNFSTAAGGLASLGSICYSNAKARGVTGIAQPINDAFSVDYVAHELGHQFGANHTFNSNVHGSCTGNRNSSTAGEPGSGSTIMAYANICSGANVQGASDPYFHYYSLNEIYNRITSSPTCAALTPTGNHEPSAITGGNNAIPKGTAFILHGDSLDLNGDTVLYCWEQTDTQNTSYPLVSTATAGPAYRSLTPTISPDRFMPAFGTVTGGSLQSTWEVTPTVGRQLNFRLTTRDYRAFGAGFAGQTSSTAKTVMVNAVAGPFVVTSQSAPESWVTGETKSITWDVAGTTGNGINAANVEISLVDSDGSAVAVLAANTANDGSHSITVPSDVNAQTRIMVKANNNIFYAINDADIALNSAPAGCTNVCVASGSTQYPDGTTLVVFNTINNASTAASAYSDYKNLSTTVDVGTTYYLTVNLDSDGNYREECKVWIDWNGDCIFNSTDEEYDLGFIVNGDGVASSNSPFAVTVPASAVPGDHVMRVVTAYVGNTTTFPADACVDGFLGEVEDYTVTVSNPAAIKDLNTFSSFVLSPNPNNGQFSIALQSDTTDNIAVRIFDLIGREVFDKSYSNNQSLFTQQINLTAINAGVYMITVSDGEKFHTQRIIIK